MSITVIEAPDAVAPIGNEILLKLQTDNRFSTAGSPASLVLTFTNIDTVAGNKLIMAWSDIELELTLATTPDDSGTQIRKATPGMPVDYWIAWFAADMMRNYYLFRDFDCVVDTNADTITLTAIEDGSLYDVTVSFHNITGVDHSQTAGADPVARDGFEIVCLTDINNSGTWEKLAEDRISPDDSEQATFALQDLFVPQLTAEYTWPEEQGTNYAQRLNHIKQYRYAYAELYDEVVRRLSTADTRLAILGAFDYKMAAALNGADYSFTDYITTYKAFLTWQPSSKTINTTQPEKLYFLVYNSISAIEIHIKVYYTDGTNSGDQELATISGVVQYDVYELMVGYGAIDFSKWSAKAVEKYEIWLEDNAGNVQSATFTYTLETKTFRHERIFLFRNSFGGFDTFRATGRKTQTSEYERLLLNKNSAGFSLQEQYQVLERSVFTVNTGWLSLAQRNWLRELLLSREAYEIMGDYKFPIVISDEKREFRDDNTYLYSLDINYNYAFKDPAFAGDYTQQPLLAENLEILLNENGEPLFA